jgi:hypothetical protein
MDFYFHFFLQDFTFLGGEIFDSLHQRHSKLGRSPQPDGQHRKEREGQRVRTSHLRPFAPLKPQEKVEIKSIEYDSHFLKLI